MLLFPLFRTFEGVQCCEIKISMKPKVVNVFCKCREENPQTGVAIAQELKQGITRLLMFGMDTGAARLHTKYLWA